MTVRQSFLYLMPVQEIPRRKICLSSIEELLVGMAGKFRMYD